MATRDTYTKVHEDWKNKPDKSTPVYAEDLEHIEQGITEAKDNRALKKIYNDDHIKLILPQVSSATTSTYTNIVEIGYAGSETEDGGEPAGESCVHTLDKEGNAFFAGDVTTAGGASLNELKEAVDNMDSGGLTEVPIATQTTIGGVKPDGTTITIDEDGTIHAASSQELAESVLGGAS